MGWVETTNQNSIVQLSFGNLFFSQRRKTAETPTNACQAGPFKEPLPWKELGLEDYPEAPAGRCAACGHFHQVFKGPFLPLEKCHVFEEDIKKVTLASPSFSRITLTAEYFSVSSGL